MIDDFQDTTGIDASNSTNEVHNNTNNDEHSNNTK